MGKKKRERKPETLAESVGFKNIFQNDKVRFMSGAFMLLIALFLLIAFVSYFITGAADQSLVEDPRADELRTIDNDAQNYCGSIGSQISYYLINVCFGIPAFIIPLFIILAGLKLMRAYNVNLLKWFLNMVLVMVWCSVAMAKFATPFFADSHIVPGGNHGEFVREWIESQIGEPGLLGVLLIIALAYLTYLSSETIIVIRKILNPKAFLKKVDFKINVPEENSEEVSAIDTVEDPDTFDDPGTQTVEFPDDGKAVVNIPAAENIAAENKDSAETIKDKAEDVGLVIDKTKEEESAGSKVLVNGKVAVPYDPKKDLENYHYPTLDLLKKYDNDGKPYIDMAEQTANKNRIVEVLRNFGVEISSIKATVGPTITLYEITPVAGVRISKIRNLEDDIALSLSALGIRIIAPIPGKGTIGIEVPNAKPNIVSMESILNSKKFQESSMELPIALGKTITNEVFMVDLAKLPHLLVAGATGQGKSVGLNAIITSLLYKKHPAELKFVLIDPKKVEFNIYSRIANHFIAKVPDDNEEPIITDVTKVIRTLKSLCKEMDDRYDLLKKAGGARNIKEYNQKFMSRQLNPDNGHRFLPYIVVIIDEFGDLIITAGKEIELPIARIAQLARAVGIHMVIATQRPTTTIITGNIKANFPGRIAFKVSAMIDSKTILDRPGANQLIGRGDMLFLNGNEPVRVQCAFVDTPEVERINQFIAQQQGYVTPFELPEPDTGDGEMGGAADVDMQHLDPLFEDAARVIVLSQSGSTSLIQRKFSIGYNRAGRIMDQMEKAGIVGVASGSKPREVLIQDEMSLENLLTNFRS